MGGFAKTIFTLITGWFQSVVAILWNGFTDHEKNGLFGWIGDHWIVIAIVLCVIGAAADLVVYIFRWRPLTVWKSFFRRMKRRKAYAAETAAEPAEGSADDEAYTEAYEETEPEYRPLFASNRSGGRHAAAEETDAGEDTAAYETEEPEAPEWDEAEPDSYRRPEAAADTFDEYPRGEDNRMAQAHPRRRRIRLSSILGDPEEDMIRFDPPKPVIDRYAAYHRPVYPRSWKENGEEAHDSDTE